jgi:hypothetical protein
MLKLMVTVFAIALAGTAGAAGWRDLRVDATSEGAFEQSLAVFKDKLSAPRRHVFGEALKDIWVAGTQAAKAEQREYTAADYYRQLDGLTYEEVVNFIDPTGETAKVRYRAATASSTAKVDSVARLPRNWTGGIPDRNSEQPRGGTPLTGPGPQQ